MSSLIITFSKRSPLIFMTAIFIFSLIGPIVANQFPVPPDTDPNHVSKLNTFHLYLIAIVLSPIIETVAFQYFSFAVAKRLFSSENLIFLAVALPFAMVHFIPSAPLPSLVNGCIGGVSLGFCYLIGTHSSQFHAFITTSAIHSAHNAFVLLFMQR